MNLKDEIIRRSGIPAANLIVTSVRSGPPDLTVLSISELAALIRRDWKNVNFAAKPYLEAMQNLDSIKDRFFNDDGISVVGYFLCNARSWTGETAKAVKAELNRRLGR